MFEAMKNKKCIISRILTFLDHVRLIGHDGTLTLQHMKTITREIMLSEDFTIPATSSSIQIVSMRKLFKNNKLIH